MSIETGNTQNQTHHTAPSIVAHHDENLKKLAEEESVAEKIHDTLENAAESTKEAAEKVADKTASTLHKAAGKIKSWTHNA